MHPCRQESMAVHSVHIIYVRIYYLHICIIYIRELTTVTRNTHLHTDQIHPIPQPIVRSMVPPTSHPFGDSSLPLPLISAVWGVPLTHKNTTLLLVAMYLCRRTFRDCVRPLSLSISFSFSLCVRVC